MKQLKKLLGVGAAVFALAALFGAGSASAQTVFCKSAPITHICPSGDVMTETSFAAHLTPGTEVKWEASYILTSCKGSEVGGTIGYAPSGSAQITKVSHSLTECTNPVTIYNHGTTLFAFWQKEGGDDGIGNLQNIEYGVKPFGVQCYYTVTPGEAGVEIKSGTSPRLVFNHKPMKKAQGGFFCPSTVYVDADYTIDTPTPLYVEQK